VFSTTHSPPALKMEVSLSAKHHYIATRLHSVTSQNTLLFNFCYKTFTSMNLVCVCVCVRARARVCMHMSMHTCICVCVCVLYLTSSDMLTQWPSPSHILMDRVSLSIDRHLWCSDMSDQHYTHLVQFCIHPHLNMK